MMRTFDFKNYLKNFTVCLALLFISLPAISAPADLCLSLFAQEESNCLVSSIHCQIPKISKYAHVEPIILDFSFDQSPLIEAPPLQKSRSLRGLFKSFVMWNPVFRKIIKSEVFSAADVYPGLAKDVLSEKLVSGVLYNIVVIQGHFIVAPADGFVNDYLSKHLFLAENRPVEFAGTIELLADGTWLVRNNSGSYKPTARSLPEIKAFLEIKIGLKNVVALEANVKPDLNPHKIEFLLSLQLSQWVEKYQRAPQLNSSDEEEQMNAKIFYIAQLLPAISNRITANAQKFLSIDVPSTNYEMKYKSTPIVERFIGEQHGKSLWSARLQKDIFFQTKYLNETERKAYELTLRNGILYDSNGQAFDSSTGDLRGLSNSTGRAMIVMDTSGNLYASNYQEVGVFHHSSFLAGQAIAFGGEAIIENGVLKNLKNLAGHYNPQTDLYVQILDRLHRGGVDITQVQLEGFE